MNFMDNLTYILLIITFVTSWVDYIRPMINKFDYKPFNCSFCLSLWISIIFVLFIGEWLILVTPLFIRIIERRLL